MPLNFYICYELTQLAFVSILQMVAVAGSSARPRSFKREEAEEEESEEESEEEQEESEVSILIISIPFFFISNYSIVNVEASTFLINSYLYLTAILAMCSQKRKGTQGIIEIENPNLVKPKNVKAKNVDIEKTTELSRREREEIEKQKAHERYMRLQEQGKTEQAKKDLERLAMIRQQRAEAAKKREEEKAGGYPDSSLFFLFPFLKSRKKARDASEIKFWRCPVIEFGCFPCNV
ncbi:hypothetical protein DVH24_003731 [Malus domestica]|uniref:Casein kinase substrate phosphoprotein PP28 domain-containing protein n=1 Tax=Malus domestica TaxID=3750 RepID=A0A498IPS7_MALDO|nr:hypothetical protein DVH24_003731 [Malus domestica]